MQQLCVFVYGNVLQSLSNTWEYVERFAKDMCPSRVLNYIGNILGGK